MAERQFVMIIRNEAGGSGAGDKLGGAGGIKTKQGGQSAKKSSKMTNGEKAANMIAKRALGMVSVASVISTVNRIHAHHNSLIEVRTGSKEQQERATFAYNTASSILGSVVGGATTGASVAGGYGALAGAAIGLVTSVGSIGINYVQQSAIIAENRQLETLTRMQTAQRVTVSGSRYMNATQI